MKIFNVKSLLLVMLVSALTSIEVEAQKMFENETSSLASQWDLCDSLSDKRGLFSVKNYKPVYFLPAKVSSNINKLPYSENPARITSEETPYDKTELKFQLSFKTKVLNNVLGNKLGGDVWVAYTQVSYWQVFNIELSRPFRETNYEPEIMFILPVKYRFLGMNSVYVGVGINHQSNGRGNPLSRSWNRVIAQFAWQGKNASMVFKPWLRLNEEAEMDDNPKISDYYGRGELLFAYGKGRHHLSCLGRHTLRLGDNNRGSIQIDYAFNVLDNLKLHTQFFLGLWRKYD